MSIPKSERLQELQAALTLRQREISQLGVRKSELIEQQRATHKSSALGSTSSAASREDPVASFVADHPVFSFCFGRESEELVWKLPIEQIGNVIAQLDAGMLALRQKQKEVTKADDAAGVQQRKASAAELRLEERIRTLADATGLPKSHTSATTAARYKTAPIGAMLDDVISGTETPAQLRQIINKARKEIHMVEIMKKKNLVVMQGFESALKRQDAIKEDIIRHRNKIRCLQRDVTEKKLTLEDMLMEHDVLDKQLTLAMKPQSGDRTRAILDRDVAELKRQMEDCVEGERRVQDRVIKAQEYRILQLEKRLASVKRALQDHNLTNRVESAILATLVNQDGGERNSNDSRSSSASMSPHRGGELPLGVDLNDKAALYNIDTIVPPQELVHPALYSLLASEKDALAAAVSGQQTTLTSRDQTVESMALEVAKLTLALDEAQTLLDMTTTQIALIEDEQQDSLVEEVLEQREQYRALLHDKNQLRRGLNNAYRSDVDVGSTSTRSASTGGGGMRATTTATDTAQVGSRGSSPSSHIAAAAAAGAQDAEESRDASPNTEEGLAHHPLRKSNSRVRFADDAAATQDPQPLASTQSFTTTPAAEPPLAPEQVDTS